jgi:ubiquinol-cytochrome c reductase cytochrome b subunit
METLMQLLKAIWEWFEDRTGTGSLVGKAARHLVPPGTDWWYVFGSATLTAFLVQVATGIALAMVYVPSTAKAYETLQFITGDAWFGNFLRGLHYFGASAMVLFIGAHMIRVFLMAAYKYPREMSWLSGVLLLGVTILMGFTGQLLRWDQNAVWSIIVAAEQAGRVPIIGKGLAHFILAGDTVGGATLTRFFAFHVFFIPAVIFAAIPLHLYLVLRNGISEPPRAGRPVDPKTYRAWYGELLRREGRPFWPDAAWRDLAFGFCMVLVLAVFALVFGPPHLGKPPDPTIIQASPRPDWYLLWYFAVLALLPHGLENYVMVGAPLLAGLVLVLLPFLFNSGERHPSRRPWAVGAVLMIALSVGTLWIAGIQTHWSPDFTAQPLRAEVIGTDHGPVYDGAQVFYAKGCIYCHRISDDGGYRGPNLTVIGERLTGNQMILRILNGGYNMPAYANNIRPADLDHVVAFLQSRVSRPQAQDDTLPGVGVSGASR